tara:strand:+ start:355 stop:609 length:255 start_codon:yes stop_codon:yes gene_type:complete
MKTITITLNKEQEELLLKKLSKATFRLNEKEITILRKDFKNPSKRTLELLEDAKRWEQKLEDEFKVSDSITNQIKKQLEERANG